MLVSLSPLSISQHLKSSSSAFRPALSNLWLLLVLGLFYVYGNPISTLLRTAFLRMRTGPRGTPTTWTRRRDRLPIYRPDAWHSKTDDDVTEGDGATRRRRHVETDVTRDPRRSCHVETHVTRGPPFQSRALSRVQTSVGIGWTERGSRVASHDEEGL